MKQMDKVLKWVGLLFGITSIGFLIFDLFFFRNLRPRMIAFQPIASADEARILWMGVGLLIYTAFCLLSLLRLANYLKRARRVGFFELILIAGSVIALLFVFADIALLNDIGKQYESRLSQPEWFILFPVIAFQLLIGLLNFLNHIFGYNKDHQTEEVALDSNIYLVVQFIGLLCGLMGLASAALAYIFPKGWTLRMHTTFSLILLLSPYALALGYWLVVKLREQNHILFDEKQQLDIGRSAFCTLLLDLIVMSALFILNYDNLAGVTSIIWLPILLFTSLFLFSTGNLVFSLREEK